MWYVEFKSYPQNIEIKNITAKPEESKRENRRCDKSNRI